MWLSFPSLSSTNPVRRETMSDGGELEHISSSRRLLNISSTHSRRALPFLQPPRRAASSPLPFLTKRHPQKDTDVEGLKIGIIKRPRSAPKPVRAGEGRSVVIHPARCPLPTGKGSPWQAINPYDYSPLETWKGDEKGNRNENGTKKGGWWGATPNKNPTQQQNPASLRRSCLQAHSFRAGPSPLATTETLLAAMAPRISEQLPEGEDSPGK